MEGRTLSHYRIIERLGGGGMGVVYKAIDTKLDRPVALKFLPPELTPDTEARQRLIREAKTASALDHPNICTVHDFDSSPEGQLFIVMSFYEGETLKKRIAGGPMPIVGALDIAIQVANGLSKAHDAGILHRDIKPANIMVLADGTVKIVDFGIAKVSGDTSATQTGTTLGTIAYMSPEQVEGRPLDGRTDVWSVGAVLYEMLTGRAPFEGDRPVSVMNAILSRTPVLVASVRADVPESLAQIVTRALQKDRDKRYPSATALAKDLTDCRAKLTAPVAVLAPRLRIKPAVAAAAAIVLVALGAAGAWSLNRNAKNRDEREKILPQILRLADEDKPAEALALVEQIERDLPGDSTLENVLPRISRSFDVTTTPPGARVLTRDYGDTSAPWRDRGVTPLANVRVPVSVLRWKFTKEGAPDVEMAFAASDGRFQVNATKKLEVAMDSSTSDRMVRIVGGAGGNTWITGIDPITRITVPDFFIDKYEVTNKEFKAFVQAGGYRKREYWDQPFIENGKALEWDAAMARFVDATGRPGPATWELGEYRAGQEDYPVTGVSWFEAVAFAKFSGKSLPTVAHWVRAAFTDYGAAIEPMSNMKGTGLAPVGKFAGLGPLGTYDMAGNAREWCWNSWESSRYILGGAWTDPEYMFTYANVQSPFDRSPVNGFRLARYAGSVPEDLTKPVQFLVRDYTKEKPVGDALFDAYRRQFSYDPAPLNAKVEPASGFSGLRAEKAIFDAPYGKDKMIAYLFFPSTGSAPYQAVLSFPGSNAIGATTFTSNDVTAFTDFALKSGRVVVVPVYRGTYERREGLTSTWPDESRRYSDFVTSWVRDARRTIDYLETRPDIDAKKIAYYGISWGGRMGAIIPAVEPRIKAVILNSGGLASGKSQPEVDQLNYITRVTQPVLMLNGRSDAIEPVDTAQRPMFDLLGSPKDQKKYLLFDDGHTVSGHRNEIAREELAWLDRFLGPAN